MSAETLCSRPLACASIVFFRHPSSGDAYASMYDVGEVNCAEEWRDALGICRPTELIDYHEPHDNHENGNIVSVFRVLRLFQP